MQSNRKVNAVVKTLTFVSGLAVLATSVKSISKSKRSHKESQGPDKLNEGTSEKDREESAISNQEHQEHKEVNHSSATTWTCPVCKKEHEIKEFGTVVTACSACGSKVEVVPVKPVVHVLNKNDSEGLCKDCAFYRKGEGEWFFCRGGGYCAFDSNNPTVRYDKDVCCRHNFQPKRRNP